MEKSLTIAIYEPHIAEAETTSDLPEEHRGTFEKLCRVFLGVPGAFAARVGTAAYVMATRPVYYAWEISEMLTLIPDPLKGSDAIHITVETFRDIRTREMLIDIKVKIDRRKLPMHPSQIPDTRKTTTSEVLPPRRMTIRNRS